MLSFGVPRMPYTMKNPKDFDLIPQRRGSLRTHRGVPLVRMLSLPCLNFRKKFPPPTTYPKSTCLFPKGEFVRTPLGVPLFGNAFSYLISNSIFSPPTTQSKYPLLIGWLVGWVVGWAYLPFFKFVWKIFVIFFFFFFKCV